MRDFVFVFFAVFAITGLIYFLYKIMLNSGKSNSNNELQITSREILQQLIILHKQKKYNIVEGLAKKYLENKGYDDDVRNVLIKTLYDSKKIYEAIDQAKIMLRHQPHNFDIKIFLANCYEDTQRINKAIILLEEVLKNDSDNVLAMKGLARLYLKANQKQSAIKNFKRLEEFLENTQEKTRNKIKIAELYTELKEYSLAIEEYKKVLEIYPEDISIKKCLIELYKLTFVHEDLIELATEIIQTCYESEDALFAMTALMDTYNVKLDYDKALEFANLINEHPLSDKIQSGGDIAIILLEKEQIEDCIELLKTLIEQDPENIKIKKNLAKAYEKKQDFESSIAVYKKILDQADVKEIEQIHFEISNIYANWAMHLFSQNDNDGCFKHFIIALQYNNQNPDIYYQIGNVNQLIKNFNEAVSQYKKAIELNPENVDYYYAIAECYEEIDSVYEQKKVLIESLNYNQDNANVHYKLGIIYELQNDLSSAVSYLKKAIELNENFVDAKYKLALIFEHMGNKEEAIELYEEILRLDPENERVANNLKMIK